MHGYKLVGRISQFEVVLHHNDVVRIRDAVKAQPPEVKREMVSTHPVVRQIFEAEHADTLGLKADQVYHFDTYSQLSAFVYAVTDCFPADRAHRVFSSMLVELTFNLHAAVAGKRVDVVSR